MQKKNDRRRIGRFPGLSGRTWRRYPAGRVAIAHPLVNRAACHDDATRRCRDATRRCRDATGRCRMNDGAGRSTDRFEEEAQ
jgi:hypothetical protein